MSLTTFKVENFRNLSQVNISPSPQVNFFCGKNGSGKTSLIEAIYYLGFGRSFRTRYFNRIIQYGQNQLSVFGEMAGIATGLQKDKHGNIRIRINQKDVFSAASLAQNFPLQLINQDSYQLIHAGPQIRRRFIDWGVFHVEPRFWPAWKQLNRVLKQRNAALRLNAGLDRLQYWDGQLVELSRLINDERKQYLQSFQPMMMELVAQLLEIEESELQFQFYSGWKEGVSLEEALSHALERDRQLGYTQHGAHRADLKIYLKKIPIQDVLSRGQQKLFVCAMQLAQGAYLRQYGSRQCVFLLDDLPSELDSVRLKMICDVLSELDTQVFISGTDASLFGPLFLGKDKKMFHVKQGGVEESSCGE